MNKKRRSSTAKKSMSKRTKGKVSPGKKHAPKKAKTGTAATVAKKKARGTGEPATSRPRAKAIAAAGDDPFGACFFTDNFGQNVCQQTTQSACAKIPGSRFLPGGRRQ